MDDYETDGSYGEDQHCYNRRTKKRKEDFDTDTDQDDDEQTSSKRLKSDKGLTYGTIFTPEPIHVETEVTLSISGCRTKLNPDSILFPQTVRFHEIKIGGGVREVFVDSLVEENEAGRISRGIITLDSLVYVVPFFDLDIKHKDTFSKTSDIITFVKDFISFILPPIKECDFVFSRRSGSSGLHLFLPKYRIYRYGLKKVTEILKTYIEKKFRDVDVDAKISHFCLPGNCKPGVVEPYKVFETNEPEPYIFPRKDSILLPINFPGLLIMINKFFLRNEETVEVDERNENDALKDTIEYFLLMLKPCIHNNDRKKCKECILIAKLTFEYMTHEEGEFRRIIYLIILSIYDHEEAQVYIHEFAKQYDWRQFDNTYLNTFKKISQKKARELTNQYLCIVQADFETFLNSKRSLSLIPYAISEHVVPPPTIVEWVWSYGDGVSVNENTLFGWIIYTCHSNITNKYEDCKLNKIQLVQMILENQQRFGYLIQEIYKLIIKKNPMLVYNRFCEIVGWEREPNYHLEYETEVSYKRDGVITAKSICSEIVYNLVIGKDLTMSHIILSTDETNIATFCFNRLFFDYMLGIDSKGMTPTMVKEYEKSKVNILDFLCNFFPIVIDQRSYATIMMLGRVISLPVNTLYFTLEKIFDDYFIFGKYARKTFDKSSLFCGVFSRSVVYAVVTRDGKLLTHNRIIDNTYSLVTMHDSTLNVDSKFIQNTNLDIKKETIENLCCTEDSGHNSMFYALQYLYMLMNFDWDDTMRLLQYFRDCMNYNAYKSIVIFYGTGQNGKTTLMNIIIKLFGAYVKTIQKTNFGKQTRDHQGDVVASKNAAIIAIDEFNILSNTIDPENIKQLSGAGFFSARGVRENAGSIKIQGSILFTCNFLGSTTDEALKLRISVFEFKNKICTIDDNSIPDIRKGKCMDYISKGDRIPISSSKLCQDFLFAGLQKLIIGYCNISSGYIWKEYVPEHLAKQIYNTDEHIIYNF